MKETPKATAAFAEFCALGVGRTLDKLAKTWKLPDGKPAANLRQIEEWSRLHNWMVRVAKYDQEQIAERERKRQDERDKMDERHAMIGTSQQKRAIEQIERLIKAERFGSQASVQLLKLATDLERLARGAPTERSEITGKDGKALIPDHDEVLGAMSDEEFEQLKQLQAKIQSRLE